MENFKNGQPDGGAITKPRGYKASYYWVAQPEGWVGEPLYKVTTESKGYKASCY